jgi:hypothetical protein
MAVVHRWGFMVMEFTTVFPVLLRGDWQTLFGFCVAGSQPLELRVRRARSQGNRTAAGRALAELPEK